MNEDKPLFRQAVPLLNANDVQAQVVELHASRGDRVKKGDLICILQSTKASFEVHAEADGFVHELYARVEDMVTAGDVLCEIGEEAPPPREASSPAAPASASDGDDAEPLRITKPAERLAEQLGIPRERLPRGILVTEAVVRGLGTPAPAPSGGEAPPTPPRGAAVIIFGGGGHALALLDILRQVRDLEPHGIVDDGTPDVEPLGLPYLGRRDVLHRLREQGIALAINAVGAVGNMRVRIAVFETLQAHGFAFPAVVHPRAVVEPTARVAGGAQVFALAYAGSGVTVGFGSIINTGSILSHDCRIGDYCHIAPGAILAGGVHVGHGTLVGSGVTTDLGIQIGRGVRIGNGTRILADVPDHTIVPAGINWTGPQAPSHGSGG